MDVLRFYGDDLAGALAAVRLSLGPDAVILSTRRAPARGVRRWMRRFDRIEVSAAGPPRAAVRPSRSHSPRVRSPAGAPGAIPRPAAAAPAPPTRLDVAEAAAADALRDALYGDVNLPASVRAPRAVAPAAGAARAVVFVGPPGGGKTLTIVKLAHYLRATGGWRVGVMTTDTYRVGAVDQLRGYAAMLALPCDVATTPAALRRALQRLSEIDVVLVDTPGSGHRDGQRVGETGAFVAAAAQAAPVEVHLVVPAATRGAELRALMSAYSPIGLTAAVVTRLDECEAPTEVPAAAAAAGLPLSYCTSGQRVPDDIALAWPDRIAEGIRRRSRADVPRGNSAASLKPGAVNAEAIRRDRVAAEGPPAADLVVAMAGRGGRDD